MTTVTPKPTSNRPESHNGRHFFEASYYVATIVRHALAAGRANARAQESEHQIRATNHQASWVANLNYAAEDEGRELGRLYAAACDLDTVLGARLAE